MKDEISEIFIKAIDNLPDDIMSAKYEGAKPKERKLKPAVKKSVYDKVIDLHGYTKDNALKILMNSLANAKGKKLHMLVITGKGNHSENNDGILRQAVRVYLEKVGKIYITDYKTASPKDGGDGAFEIFTK